MKIEVKEKNKNKAIIFLLFLILCVSTQVIGQGFIVTKEVNKTPIVELPEKIDPARYEKILNVSIGLGQSNADDLAFRKWLRSYSYPISGNNFTDLVVKLSYLKKRFNVGFDANAAYSNQESKPNLRHGTFVGKIGYALVRKRSNLLIFNINIGTQKSTIKLGDDPPTFLYNLNLPNSECSLTQKQIVVGPSLKLNKLFDTNNNGQGFSIGFEIGANFVPIAPKNWEYGYYDEEGAFQGARFTDLPRAAKNTFYTNITFGFWSAK